MMLCCALHGASCSVHAFFFGTSYLVSFMSNKVKIFFFGFKICKPVLFLFLLTKEKIEQALTG